MSIIAMVEQIENLDFITLEITSREISSPEVMSKDPLVSVKMLTYNHEPYIAQAIEGVLLQETDFPIELVIGEDCSTDKTREIVLKYQQMHPDLIRVIVRDTNVGASKNTQHIDKLIRGKYLAWCEGDDYWTHPKKLQRQAEILEADTEVGVVHCGHDDFLVQTGTLLPWSIRNSDNTNADNVFLRMLQSEYQMSTLTMMVRRELYASLFNKYPDIMYASKMFGDLQFKLLLAYLSKVVFINESMAIRNILSESASHSKSTDHMVNMIEEVLSMQLRFWKIFDATPAVEDKIRQKYYESMLALSFDRLDWDLALKTRRQMAENGLQLNPKQYLFYRGSKNAMIRKALKLMMAARRKIRRIGAIRR